MDERDVCSYCEETFPLGSLYAWGLSGAKVKACQRCLQDVAWSDDTAEDEGE